MERMVSDDHLAGWIELWQTDTVGRGILGRAWACLRAQAWKCTFKMFLEQGRHGGAKWKMWLARWVGCTLDFRSHGKESGLVRNICKSYAVGTIRCSVVSVDSALLSLSLLPFYFARHGWETGESRRGGTGLNVLACSLYGTIASGLFIVLNGQPLPLSPPSGVTQQGPPQAERPSLKLHK